MFIFENKLCMKKEKMNCFDKLIARYAKQLFGKKKSHSHYQKM